MPIEFAGICENPKPTEFSMRPPTPIQETGPVDLGAVVTTTTAMKEK